MPEKSLTAIPRPLREQYEKGLAALQRQNFDYAIVILEQVLQQEPGFYAGREALHNSATLGSSLRSRKAPEEQMNELRVLDFLGNRESARESALLIVWTLSPGCATKKFSIGSDRPGVCPVDHVVPEELDCASGTWTSYVNVPPGTSSVRVVGSVICAPLCGSCPY